MTTMLQKALAQEVYASKKPITAEEIELAVAWYQGVITIGQATVAYGKSVTSSNTQIMYRMAHVLRGAIVGGKATLVKS